MKHSTKMWVTIAAVLGVGAGTVFAYEHWMGGTTLTPGAIALPMPSSGTQAFKLPMGAKSWTGALAGTTALTVPTSPSMHLVATVSKGLVVTITWVDSSGATQISIVTFS